MAEDAHRHHVRCEHETHRPQERCPEAAVQAAQKNVDAEARRREVAEQPAEGRRERRARHEPDQLAEPAHERRLVLATRALLPLGALPLLAPRTLVAALPGLAMVVRLYQRPMRQAIRREDRRMSRRYVTSARHTIQVDFYDYLRTVARERRRRRGHPVAALRADRSHELRVGSPA